VKPSAWQVRRREQSSPFLSKDQASLDDLAAYRLLITAAFGVGWSNAAPRYLGYTKRTVQRWLQGERAIPYRVIRTLEDKLVQRVASLPALEAEERQHAEDRRQLLARAMTVARRLVNRGPVNPSAGRNAGRPTGRTLIAVRRAAAAGPEGTKATVTTVFDLAHGGIGDIARPPLRAMRRSRHKVNGDHLPAGLSAKNGIQNS
jgi:hypothetical protein